MLAARQRLRRRVDFTAAVRGGRRGGLGALVVHLAVSSTSPREDRSCARAGFVIPRAVGPAVSRNRIRRRLRDLIRNRLADLPPGTDIVIRALPGAAGRSYQQLGVDLDGAIGAAGDRKARMRRSGAAR